MPYENHPSSFTDYLNTLGEIQGLLDSHSYSGAFLIGDFNVDFDRNSPLTDLLCSFMTELDLVASDLQYKDSILFTYERDGGGLCRSWIDHILCSRSCSTLVSNTFASHSGSNLSDHSPLFFSIHARRVARGGAHGARAPPLLPNIIREEYLDVQLSTPPSLSHLDTGLAKLKSTKVLEREARSTPRRHKLRPTRRSTTPPMHGAHALHQRAEEGGANYFCTLLHVFRSTNLRIGSVAL